MIELANFEKNEPSPDSYQVKPLSRITFIGLLNSFDYARNFLLKLKEQGSIDILKVKGDMIKARNHLLQINLEIETILNSYKKGFNIESGAMKCDFCPDPAKKYREFHKWCESCFNREFGCEIRK